MPNESTALNSLSQTAALGISLCIALPIAGICSAVADHFLNDSSATVVLGLGAPFLIFLAGAAMHSLLKKCFSSLESTEALEKAHDQFLMRTVAGGVLALLIAAFATSSCSTGVMMIASLANFALGSLVGGLGIEFAKGQLAPKQPEDLDLVSLSSAG